MGTSRMAKQLFLFSQKAMRDAWTSGAVTPGMAMMETLPFSWKACRPVRLPGPSSLPRKASGVTVRTEPLLPPWRVRTSSLPEPPHSS